MWSLPDIQSLNAQAAANASKLKREVRRKKKPACEYYHCKHKATISYLVYDIFSDDPKSAIHLCEHHDGYSGSPLEGYFTCAHCNRVMAENYTWEMYYVWLNDEQVCLKCAAEAYFADEKNWIDPKDVTNVVLEPGGEVLFEAGVLNIAKCRHVLGVKQPLPPGIEFVDNAEFDSMDGHQISDASNNFSSSVNVLNSTIAYNDAYTGSGISHTNGSFNITNTIVGNNVSSTSSTDCAGSLSQVGVTV